MENENIFDRQKVLQMVNPSPIWLGDFSKFVYEKIETDLEYCLINLHTCWNFNIGRPKFIDLAKKIANKDLELEPLKMKKISQLAKGYIDVKIKVSAFRHKDLKEIRDKEYQKSTLPDEVYIAEDHNHRFTSYALQYLKNDLIGKIPVELFLGKVTDKNI